jgi:aminoglycoside phosphotransferase (APT) family kinase protein
VIKAASAPAKLADLRREARVLGLLHGRRLGAPSALAFAEGAGYAVLVTRRRPGRPGITFYNGPSEALALACTALGRALARLHAAPLVIPSAAPELDISIRTTTLCAELAALPLPADLGEALSAALAHPGWRPTQPRLVHGDAGLHNVLWGQRRFTLLDWELAGWGDPRLDLAWAAWTLRFRGAPPALWEALLGGYGREQAAALGLDDTTLRAFALGQVAALLARAAPNPAAWEEWLRRAHLTLYMNQIAPG